MPQDISANNKRIAKNTLMLYFRTFITMIVGLYTGRVMLQALGVEDYGIYSVIGGIIGFSCIITGAASQSISRYITCALGETDKEKLKNVFSTAINVQIIIIILVLICLEIVGLWFIECKASIPENRLIAAHWVFQFSLVSLAVSLLGAPFSALIIAYERMNAYAMITIIESLLKLIIYFIVSIGDKDRLVLLALLQIIVGLIVQLGFILCCKKFFNSIRYNYKICDKKLLKELISFSGWNLLGSTSWVLNTQGLNLLVNVFFGVTFNAARGLAVTISQAVNNFVANFTTAFTPQIMKSYAAKDIDYAIALTNRSTKFTWLMLYVFLVPVCVESETLLKLWLGEIPEMAPTFLRISMFESLAILSGTSLLKLVQANGNIKIYQIEITIGGFFVFPIAWLLYALGAPVWSAYVVFVIIYFGLNLIRYRRLRTLMPFSIRKHLKEVILPCSLVSLSSFIPPVIIMFLFEQSTFRFFLNVPVAIISTLFCCVIFGLTKSERLFIVTKLKRII